MAHQAAMEGEAASALSPGLTGETEDVEGLVASGGGSELNEEEKEEEEFSRDNEVVGSDIMKRSNTDLQFAMRLQAFRKVPRQYSRWGSLVLAYQTLGVVYGDIGTSPLYVYSSTNIKDPQVEDFLGAMSIMFWTISLIPLLKYVFVVLRADDHGEGGSFSIYSKLCQHARIGQTTGRQYTPMASDARLAYHGSRQENKMKPGSIHAAAKRALEGSKAAQRALLLMVMLGTSMIMGDGVLTPAISVMSAVAGIKSAPGVSISQTAVIAASSVILLILFLSQRFGTAKVAVCFSPIMLTWFIPNAIIGIYNIVKFDPSVVKAVSPHYIWIFFSRNGSEGWKALSGLVLVITGSEAMFWDLGHFNQAAIKQAFTFLVYPSLILTYMGQTAFCIKHPASISNAFWDSIPHGLFWPMLIVATAAAVIASQALISASFCVFKQSIALGCFPRVQIINTSDKEAGQIYCPAANYLLMVLCLAVVLGFRDGNRIASAYGVSVLFDLLITTCLVSLVMLIIWQTPWPLLLLFFCTFVAVESVFLSSVLEKVVHGGWVSFAIAACFMSVMVVWTWGRRKKHSYEVQHRLTPDGLHRLLATSAIHRVPGICFFYSDLLDGPPPVFSHYVTNVRSLHQILVFTTVRIIPVKTVQPSERYLVGKVGYGGVYRCVVRFGYMDLVDTDATNGFMPQVIQCLKAYLHGHAKDPTAAQELLEVEVAEKSGAVYVVGKATLHISPQATWFQRLLGNHLYYLLHHNCRSAIADLHVHTSNLLEVRMVYDWKPSSSSNSSECVKGCE